MLTERTIASALPARKLVMVSPADSVFQAAVLMAEANCGSALVVSDGVVVGIITERDVITRIVAKSLDPATTSVEAAMTRKPVCASPEMPVTHALYTMMELGFRHFPVVDPAHKPLGVFSLRDAYIDELVGADGLASIKTKKLRTLPAEAARRDAEGKAS